LTYSADNTPLAPAGTHAGSPQAQDRDTARAAARDLLARTVELPATTRELLAVLSDYRKMVFALAWPDATETASVASVPPVRSLRPQPRRCG
jgi:hypothetical protein